MSCLLSLKHVLVLLGAFIVILTGGMNFSGSFANKPAHPTTGQAAEANWLTIAENGRYLAFEDGGSFLPLGISMDGDHIHMDYYGRAKINGAQIAFSDHRAG